MKSKYKYIIYIIISRKTDFTLLFSHDNRTSLGMIYPTLFDLSSSLKCDVISYDYSGYGCSTGTPSETEITDDIVHVMSFCSNIIHIPLNKLILFGHSIGTIPTIHLSSLNTFRDLGGVVLISPSSTGLINDYKEDNKTKRRKLSTVNSNYNVNDIACPVFLIHGQKDNIIPVSHSHELSEEIKYSGKSYCWFPKKGTHYNIMYDLRRKFYRKFMYFLDLIERFHKQINENLMFKSDLNIKPISHISNVSIGKPREENYIANKNQYNNNKELESSSFEGNNSSNFIVMNEPERITAPTMMNVNEHK